MMMTSDHPSHARDHIRFIFGPIYSDTCEQLPDLVRGEGTGTGIAHVSGGLDFYALMIST
jgi:hypothetical protein